MNVRCFLICALLFAADFILIHICICFFEKLVDIEVGGEEAYCRADACRYFIRLARGFVYFREGKVEAFGTNDLIDIVIFSDTYHIEFIAACADADLVISLYAADGCGDSVYSVVALAVAVGIVDMFKTVHIDDEDYDGIACICGA